MSRINDSRANAEEEHAILSELGTVLGHDGIESGFVD